MKTGWNKKTNLPTMEFEDTDYLKAQEIEQMISGKHVCRKCNTENESKAWETLRGYFEARRLAIEELGKSHARSRAKRDVCSNVFSILDGFDMAVDLAAKVVLQAKMMRDLQEKTQKSEEVSNESRNDEFDGD